MRMMKYGIGLAWVLLLGCDQQASIGERGDAAAMTHGSDGSVAGCNLPTCGNYVFPPSPRLVRVVERSADGSSKNLLDLRYNSAGEIVNQTSGSVVMQYTYEGGRVTKIESFRDGVLGSEVTLSWQGDRYLGSEGWFDFRVWSDTAEGGSFHSSETRTYGPLGVESIEGQSTDSNGNTSTSLRSIMYAETGMIDRWSSDLNSTAIMSAGTELFYASGRISRALRMTRYSSPEREVIFETQFTYDANGRLASAEADTTTYTYFYNASGFISRIESERDGQRGVTLELTYETGTTPSIQFHHAGFVTVRGEVTPMVSFTGYSFPFNPLDNWLF